jgi:hypothetical protein
MRLVLLLSACAAMLLPHLGKAQPAPVVLELFTSQGCSSCPPADALLAQLAGTEGVIALALHVDYWDYLGWPDGFADPRFTDRQRAYAKVARSRTIFTPEMVVQGTERLKGHDAARIADRIAQHRLREAPAKLTLEPDGEGLAIRLEPLRPDLGPVDVQVARFVAQQVVDIEAGENAGQTLTYTNIVSDWQTIGRWDGSSPAEMRLDQRGEGPLAVIVQQSRMGPILTAARWP